MRMHVFMYVFIYTHHKPHNTTFSVARERAPQSCEHSLVRACEGVFCVKLPLAQERE